MAGGGKLLVKVGTSAASHDQFVMSSLALAGSTSSPFAVTVAGNGSGPTLATGTRFVLAEDVEPAATNPFASANAAATLAGLTLTVTNGLRSAGGTLALATQSDPTSGGGFDLVAVATPEPTSLALLAAAAAPLALARRQRRRPPQR